MKVKINAVEYDVTVKLHSSEVVHNGEVIGVVQRKDKRKWLSMRNGTQYECDTRNNAVRAVLEQTLKEANNRG